ncbi:hypothetical protein EBZ35_09095, partial [bacterium]|nr:hypothetical protein [bacterium]
MPPIVVSDLKSDNNNNQDNTNNNTNNNNKSNTGYVYDERMLHHFDPVDPEHPEKPARITSIYKKLQEAKLLDQARRIPIQVKLAEFGPEVQAVHDPKYCRKVNQSSLIRNVEELYRFSGDFDSVYFNASTAISATVAAVATIELCKAIGRGEIENGFGIIRPPGHHAEPDQAMGFCIYNNVAIAASTLLRHGLAKRVLILDWDVHHGNGTQDIFAASGDVLYVSVHRHDGGRFYPHVPEAGHTFVGSGKTGGLGRSINVAWNGPGFGDADYLYAFSRLIMPVAREFDPDFVIVSAGFDAASGDPIGECEVTTFGYSMMLRELMTLAGGRVAVILEGGYNLEVISKCYEACVRTLLKQPA